MKKARFSEEKMVLILQEADRTSVAAVVIARSRPRPARFPYMVRRQVYSPFAGATFSGRVGGLRFARMRSQMSLVPVFRPPKSIMLS